VIRLVVLAVVLAVAAPTALAQPGRNQAGAVDRRERIKKRIRALRAYTLTEELSLDEATAAKLFPILAKYDDEIGKHLVARVKLRHDLDVAIGKNDDKAVDKAIDDMVANQKALWGIDEKRFAELRKALTPSQAGKLLVVLPALERKVQNMLQRAMTARGRAGAGAGRRAVEDDNLDDDNLDDFGENPYPK
jgi:Spy/CpxP family protein refolding chaperone